MNDDNRIFTPPDNTVGEHAQSRWHRLVAGRRVLLVVVVLIALALLAWLLTPKGTRPPAGRYGAGGPMPVVGAPAVSGDMPIVLNGLGAVTPIATVTVQSQISGQITQIPFKEGQIVKPGDPLIQIDPRPYQVALEQAEGALVRDKALLANAKVDLARYETLFKEDSVAEQTLATQRSLVVQDEGNVKTDQGQIDASKLNLIYCHIVSPISGRVGLQQVNLGNYVTPAEPNGLVVVTQLQPITVVFTLPEDQIPALQEQLHAGKTLGVTAYDRSHTTQLATGTLQTIDNQIDPTTGTVKLKAIFANSNETLFPNQFVNIALLLNTLHNATLIPQAGVQRGAPGTYVYLIDAQQSVSVRKVALGPGDATNVVITNGLKPGDMVVVDGADKLKDGAKVVARKQSTAATTPAAAAQHRHRKTDPNAPAAHGTQPAAQ
jgi:membrane fusion protein, multidrug efflux system